MENNPNSIPFSATVPTEAGVYLWRLHKLDDRPITLNVEKRDDGQLYDRSSPTPIYYSGEYSPKLIPSTELDQLKKRVVELEHCLRQTFYWRMPLGTQLAEEIFEQNNPLFERVWELLKDK